MKYLKFFNEAYRSNTTPGRMESAIKLRDFCIDYLAYLVDDSYKVNISPNYGSFTFNISRGIFFKWSDISDHFVPFLHMLENEYDLSDAYIKFKYDNGDKSANLSIKDVLDEKFSHDMIKVKSDTKYMRKELGYKLAYTYKQVKLRVVTIENIRLK